MLHALDMFSFPDKMLRVFRDPELQSLFEKKGFIQIPFYNEDEITELKRVYQALHKEPVKGFYASTFSLDKDHRKEVDKVVKAAGARQMAAIFENYKVLFGSFIVKGPDPKSEMGIHQDMTLVDESRFVGINIWVPLVDLDEQNGALWILPGSHRLMPTLRGATIPGIYVDAKEQIKTYMQPLYLKAGQAVIFDQSILHYSPPNESLSERVVTNTFFTHVEAQMQIVYSDPKHPSRTVEIFHQEDDFMYHNLHFGYDIYARPSTGTLVASMHYDFPRLSPRDLAAKYAPPTNPSPENRPKLSFWKRIRQWW